MNYLVLSYIMGCFALNLGFFFLAAVTAVLGADRCNVASGGSPDIDDAPAIRQAFEACGRDGHVYFSPGVTYHINSPLDIRGLSNVDIDLHGTLLWSEDIDYWLANSLEVGYQNQSTAFILGGDNVRLNGHNSGVLDGNGDFWYEWILEQPNPSNYPGRPHAITFNGLTNSVVRDLAFVRSQMWTMSLIYSKNVLLDNILVNNTGNREQSINTDGADTIRSDNITFNRWTVYNNDDSISFKGDSRDIRITNSVFYDGTGIAVGSIGQFKDLEEHIERVYVENVTFINTFHAVWFKTWTADQNGYPPNGGGGGTGSANNMTFNDLHAEGLRGSAFAISQCTRFQGAPGDGNCTNSEFQIRDITVQGLSGTSASDRVASLQCSAVAPCTNIGLLDFDLRFANGTDVSQYLCGNVVDQRGFTCTGVPCEGGTGIGEC
jgi:polygalacturonase